jgi:murein L,D-transpeptidase YcbB/YkuD
VSNIEALAQYVPDAWRAWQHLGEIRAMQQRATPHIQALMAMMPEAQRLYAEIFPELQQAPKTSINVAQLQEMLNHYGASLRVDGNYGSATKNAVENYQRGNGLTVDGWAGNETLHHLYGQVSREAAGTR